MKLKNVTSLTMEIPFICVVILVLILMFKGNAKAIMAISVGGLMAIMAILIYRFEKEKKQ